MEAGTASDTATARRGRPPKVSHEQGDFLVGCTPEERAQCVRLVRLLRDNYWVSELIRQILTMEAETRYELTIKGIQRLLNNFDTLEALADNAKNLGQNWSNHPILRAIRDEWSEIKDYKDDRMIQRLIDSAHKR